MKTPKRIIKEEKTIDNKGYLRLLDSYKESKELYRTSFYKMKECLEVLNKNEGKRFILKALYQERVNDSASIIHALMPLLSTLEGVLNIPDNESIHQLKRDEERNNDLDKDIEIQQKIELILMDR
ncbi:MAG: hypothetical protein PVG30_02065 [Gammaproteobacteria bacterium]|jgi:hypothetical protein